MDCAGNMEHLQTVFRKYDANAVISEPVLICLFHNGLKLFIRTQAKQEGRWKDTWDQAIKKDIMAEAKAALNFSLLVCKMDACCCWGHRSLLKPTKDHTWDQASLSFCC